MHIDIGKSQFFDYINKNYKGDYTYEAIEALYEEFEMLEGNLEDDSLEICNDLIQQYTEYSARDFFYEYFEESDITISDYDCKFKELPLEDILTIILESDYYVISFDDNKSLLCRGY